MSKLKKKDHSTYCKMLEVYFFKYFFQEVERFLSMCYNPNLTKIRNNGQIILIIFKFYNKKSSKTSKDNWKIRTVICHSLDRKVLMDNFQNVKNMTYKYKMNVSKISLTR